MLDVPTAIVNYLLNLIVENRSLAYLLVEKDGCLSDWGGKLAMYGVTNLKKGENVGQQVFFLEGLLPLDNVPLFLPCIQTTDGLCADLHIFPSEVGDWVLLLDASLETMQIRLLQQEGNQATLWQQKLSKITNQ